MKRASRAEWAARVAKLKESGLSGEQFAASIEVHPKTLAWWRRELALSSSRSKGALATKRVDRPVAITPLNFVEVTPRSDAGAVDVVLASGMSIRVRPGFDSATLARVLDVMESRRP